MKKVLLLGCMLGVVLLVSPAQAAFLDAPVPSNAYITYNGIDWAWASPCSGDNCGDGFGLDLSYQSAFGWHIPSAPELALAPLSGLDFVFAGANVPQDGVDPVSGAFAGIGASLVPGDIAIAVPYFNTLYRHGDWADSPGGINNLPWNTLASFEGLDNSEFLVARSVPEPSTLLLFGVGLAGVGLLRRRFKK